MTQRCIALLPWAAPTSPGWVARFVRIWLYPWSYKPTDIDLCAYLDGNDREELVGLGFKHLLDDHFTYTFRDGEKWPVEFPDSVVDGDVMRVALDGDGMLTVIGTESLVLDRIRRATDRTQVSFDEAVRRSRAVLQTANWDIIQSKVREEDRQAPTLRLLEPSRKSWRGPAEPTLMNEPDAVESGR